MPGGRIYEAFELGRNLQVGTEKVAAVVRVRLKTQKNFALALYLDGHRKMAFIDTRPDTAPLLHEPFGEVDLRIIEADIKEHYGQQEYRVPMEGYERMMHYVRARILTDAFELYEKNQSKSARALSMARSVFQDNRQKYPLLPQSDADAFKATLRIQGYQLMVDEFERKLLLYAMKESDDVKLRAADRLRMPRQTLSERLRLLEIAV